VGFAVAKPFPDENISQDQKGGGRQEQAYPVADPEFPAHSLVATN